MAFNPGNTQEEADRAARRARVKQSGDDVHVCVVLTAEQYEVLEQARLDALASPLGCALAEVLDATIDYDSE